MSQTDYIVMSTLQYRQTIKCRWKTKKCCRSFSLSKKWPIFAIQNWTITHCCYQNSKIITIKTYIEMKKGLHPENYRPVVFKDMSNGDMFLSRSTVATKETIEFEVKLIRFWKLKSLAHHTPSTPVNLNWWIQQVVLISSWAVMVTAWKSNL